jgi:hypothetical protein
MIIYGDTAVILTLSDEEKRHIAKGQAFVRGSKVYAVCPSCHRLVRLNKPVFGSLHTCDVP